MREHNPFSIHVAEEKHTEYAAAICLEMAESAKLRGTGIAYRSPEYIIAKMQEGRAIIALHLSGNWAGFCYIETWSHGDFVANSGLIVNPVYRKHGLARAIKRRIFDLSREKFPESKIFGLTTGLAVMKINSELGYEPVTYAELTQDQDFWKGCQSCVNYEILMGKERTNCLCTAMLFDPAELVKDKVRPGRNFAEDFRKRYRLYERWMRIKAYRLLKHSLLKEKRNNLPD